MTELALGLTVAGFLTATLSGVAGVGGGTILVGLFYALGLAPVEAVPLLAAVQFVANSSRTVAYARHVDWCATGWFLLTAVPFTFLVAPYVELANKDIVCLVLAGLMIASLVGTEGKQAPLPRTPSFVLAGALNGALGMFLGATGLFVGRLFLRPEWRKETTIGTLALTQTFGHALRVIAYGAAGYSALKDPWLLGPVCIAVIAGTALGKKLNGHLDEARFAQLFKAILLILSLKLIWDSLRGFGWI